MDIKVLIVDDEVNIAEMVRDVLEEYGFQTFAAYNAPSAVTAMDTFKPAIALVDYKLDTFTGFEVAHSLREKDPDIPIILMTAFPSMELAVKAIKEDVYDFIAKPLDRIYLARSVAKAIEKRSLIDENKRLVHDLQESNESLKRTDRVKSKFLSIMTHDLRTPLTTIRGFCDMLKDEKNLSKEEKVKCLTHIDQAVGRMNELVVSLFDMVSIEAGKLRIDKKPIDYVQLCRELEGGMAPLAQKKKIGLVWSLLPGKLKVVGDSGRLLQVLSNLVSNAFKHTPAVGSVAVRISLNDGKILTEVADTGEGLAPEDLSRIFEQFYQVESSPHKREGLGLGLSIAKEIITAHGGEIGVKSPGLGKGSTFYFTLPAG